MAKTYFTLTGTKHYYGTDFLEKGMKITLEKEPDNEYDFCTTLSPSEIAI